jgi:hypothetical protein
MLKKIGCLTFFILFSLRGTISAYDKETIHPLLSKIAAENSILNFDNGDYLDNIGFKNNLKEKLLGITILDLIKNGSKYEDYEGNYFNHFHNPLKAWQDAGLDIDLLFINPLLDPFVDLIVNSQSSLLWAQDSKNEFSWQNVRQYFYDALTTGSEESFAKTFEGLGHLIHLLQDAAQPAHVKNDAHPLDGLGLVNGLETWAKDHPGKIEDYASSPEFPTVDLNAYIYGYEPITQFFDTDTYTYDTNPSTTLNQGIAEYTNANFASDDTIFTENFNSNHRHYFPFPRKEDTIKYYEFIGNGKYRYYFKKFRNGETVNHLATEEGLFRKMFPWNILQRSFYFLDEQCHNDYAEKLIPRAVGYSTGLIDYFFRGEIYLVPEDAPGTGYMIENNTEEDMEGKFELFYDNTRNKRVSIWSSSFYLGTVSSGNNKSSNFEFKVPNDAKDPCKYILVFRGRLGNESNAVVGKVWSREFKLTASDAVHGDHFGYSVAISGDVAIVGAPKSRDAGNNSGSAYIFVRNGNTWEEQAKLTASDAAQDDFFGLSVAINGDVAIVGAHLNDDAGNASGSAYVFVRNGDTWQQQAKLTASDAAQYFYFGRSVAISGDVAIVGAGNDPGSAYVFVRNGDIWQQQAKLTASDDIPEDEDRFGSSVAISGDVVIVGDYWQGEPYNRPGAAYIFVRNGDIWQQQAKLTTSDAARYPLFGSSVAISGDVAIVGAHWNEDAGSQSGAAYVFVRNGNTWQQQAKLTASDAAEEDRFGRSVAISGDVAIVGAHWNDDAGDRSGSAYVFVRNGNMWQQQRKLTTCDASAYDWFGHSVAISGDVAIVGAPLKRDDTGDRPGSEYRPGSAYVYENLP